MRGNKSSDKHLITQACFNNGSAVADLTAKSYKASIKQYAAYMKECCTTFNDVQHDPVRHIERYVDHLISCGNSAATIHTKIAPLCRAFRLDMAEITNKPIRVVAQGSRALKGQSARSEREMQLPQYQRAAKLSREIGIREAELKRLTGADIRHNQYGELVVIVPKGKGGKYQEQVILPQYENDVLDAFARVKLQDKVFRAEEFSKNISYHRNRAELAKEAYSYYCLNYNNYSQRLELANQLWDKFLTELQKQLASGKLSSSEASARRSKFAYELNNRDKPICLRKDNLHRAIDQGMPTKLDRLSVLAVSVNHLSHWRTDVTIANYLLKP